jgi:RND family efflux transporter MFP subunit
MVAALLLSAAPAWPAEPLEGLALPYRQVEVSAPVASFLVEMKVQEGELVKAGQPLAQLYGKLDELELKRTKAILERREFEAKGVKNLYDSKILPEAKALEARIELDLARLNFETAAEQVRLRAIVAPIDGVVVERYREVGEAVQAAQRVFRIVDLSRLAILCRLKPEQAVLALAGQRWPVRFPQLPQEPVLQAEVVFVDPCADASGLIRLKLLLENPNGRLPAGCKALVDGPWNGARALQPSVPKAP